MLAAFVAAALLACLGAANAPAQQTLTWVGGVSDDMQNPANWSPPTFPFGANIVFNGTSSNPARWEPAGSMFGSELAVFSMTTDGYAGTITIQAVPTTRILTPGSEQQVDSASISSINDININGGTIIVRDSSFTPATAAGDVRSEAFLRTQGDINFAGGTIQLSHVASHPDIQFAYAGLEMAQGDFNWSGGNIVLDATEASVFNTPLIRLGGNWNQSTPNFPGISGTHGLLELNGDPFLGVTEQRFNASTAANAAATTPSVRTSPNVPTIIPAGTNLYALAAIDRNNQNPGISLTVGLETTDFQPFNGTSVLLGGAAVGPISSALLQMGANRKIDSGGDLIMTGGTLNATAGGNRLDFEGTMLFDHMLSIQPPANLNVSGGGSSFRSGGWRVLENISGSEFNANLAGVGEFFVGGTFTQADFLHVGDTNVSFPNIIKLAGPDNTSADSFWSANDETRVFQQLVIAPPKRTGVSEGPLKLRNPPNDIPGAPWPPFNITIQDRFSVTANFADAGRLQILDGREIDVTSPSAQEIENSGIIEIINGKLLRPTLSIEFTDRDGNPQSLYGIGRDQVYATIRDSDKNLNGVNVFDTLPSVMFELFTPGFTLLETEVLDQNSGPLMKFTETGVRNWTFRNRVNGIPLEDRAAGPNVNNDGELRAQAGDILRVTYIDPNGSGGPCCAEVVIPSPNPPPPLPDGAPDLEITDCDVAATLTEAIYTATVCNSGTEDIIQPFEVGIYYDLPSAPALGQTPDAVVTIGLGDERSLTVEPGVNVGDGSVANAMAADGSPEETWTLTCVTDSVTLTPGAMNVGDGTFSVLTTEPGAPDETWTLTCVDATVPGQEVFSVVGSVSGAQANITVGFLYGNTFLRLMLDPGATGFALDDTFTLDVLGAGMEVFSVVGSVSGAQANATVGVPYNNGLISFTIGAGGLVNFQEGDSFTITSEAISLAAGACVDIMHTLPAPPQGNFEAWFYADWPGVIDEQNENNNQCGPAFYSVQPDALPDLTFVSFDATVMGVGVTYDIVVVNQGDANSPPCTLGLSYDGGPQTDLTANVPALNVTETAMITLFRLNTPDGSYVAEARVDTPIASMGVVAESNEGNNVLASNPHTVDSGAMMGGNRLVTFNSLGADAVPIILDTADFNGATDGNTQFTRLYGPSVSTVGATAPSTHDGASFQRWFDVLANATISGSETASLPISDGAIYRAEYQQDPGNPLPDLTISSFTGAPSGTAISFSVTARNSGNAMSGACQLAIFYDMVGNPSAGPDAFVAIPALAPGATATQSHLFSGAALGQYMPRAFVDQPLTVTESVESNNESFLTGGSTTITVDGTGGSPDLAIPSFTAVAMGATTDYSVTVSNQGTVASTATNLTLSYDNGPQTDDATTVPALNPSQSMVFNFQRTGAPPGTYTARATVDAAMSVAELNEGNNTALSNAHTNTSVGPGVGNTVTFSSGVVDMVPVAISDADLGGQTNGVTTFVRQFDAGLATTTATAPATHNGANFVQWTNTATSAVITTNPAATLTLSDGLSVRADYMADPGNPMPDLTVTSFTANLSGADIVLAATVQNIGNAAAGASTFSFYFNHDVVASPPNGDVQLAAGGLAPGATQTFNFTLPNAPAGQYLPEAFIDSLLVVAESAEGNNRTGPTAAPVVINSGGPGGGELPDLTIPSFVATVLDDDATLAITVQNSGTASTLATQLNISFNGDAAVDATRLVGALAPGGSQMFSVPRLNIAPGTYSSSATADGLNSATESNEGNNTTFSNAYTVLAAPGLGNTITISSGVADMVPITMGAADLNGMTDGVTTFTRQYDAAVTTVTANAPAIHNGAFFLQWTDTATSAVISAIPNATLTITDGLSARADYMADPGNPLPDLTVTSLTANLAGSDIFLAATVQNIGNADSAPCTFSFYMNQSGFPSPPNGDALFPIGVLTPGATANIGFSLPNAPAGTYTPEAFVDSLMVVAESAESNNRLGSAPTLVNAPGPMGGELPDLAIPSFVANVAGSDAMLDITVSNAGTASSSASRLDVSFNGDATIDATPTIPALAPGANTVIRVDRLGAPDGTYTSTALADAGAVVAESNEGNNFASSNAYMIGTVVGAGNTVTISSGVVDMVPITMSAPDLNGMGDGVTTFVRQYDFAVPTVMATAPATHNGAAFVQWTNTATSAVISATPTATLNIVDGLAARADYMADPGNPMPDLTVTSFTANLVGADIVLAATVQNIGNAASTPCAFSFYFNQSGFPSPPNGDVQLSAGGLAPGATQSFNFTLPSAPAGIYTPEAFIDSLMAVAESAEGNNRTGPTSAPVFIDAPGPGGGELPDLTITSFVATAMGQDAALDITVRNAGLVASSSASRLDVSFNGDATIDAMPTIPVLAPGASAVIRVDRLGAAPGTYTSTALADAGSVVVESNEGNNSASSNPYTIMVGPGMGNTVNFSSGVEDMVPITLDVADLNGFTNGVTSFTRQYDVAVASVMATAPATHNGSTFLHWIDTTTSTVLSAAPTVTFAPSDGLSIRADYMADPGNPMPDLTVTSFDATLVGADIVFAATVQNIGNADAGPNTFALYFNHDVNPSPPDGDVQFPVGLLVPGATQSFNFTFPNAPDGTYTPLAFVDSQDAIVESAEGNNVIGPTSSPVFVDTGGPGGGEMPDLTIASFVATALGQGTTYEVIVNNQGAASSTAVRLDVSFDGGGGADATDTVPALAPGGNAMLTLFRMNAPAGTYTATAFVDAGLALPESDENNNMASSNPHTNTTVDPGDGQLVTFSASNVDSVPVGISQADLFGFTDGVTIFSRQFADTTNTVVATAPANHQGRPFVQWFDTSNGIVISTATAATINVAPGLAVRADYEPDPGNPLPDLVVDSFDVTVAGGALNFTATARNAGNADAAPCVLAVFYNLDGTPSPPNGDNLAPIPLLTPGATSTVNLSFPAAPEGTYRPVAFVDIFAAIPESAEGNNASNPTSGDIEGDGSVVVGGSNSDLTITAFTATALGQGTTYNVTVQNIGTGDSDAAFLGLSYEGASNDATAAIPVLAPAQTMDFTLVRMNAPPGTYTARATADVFGDVDELDEGNNVAFSNQHTNTQVNPGDGQLMTFGAIRADTVPIGIGTADLFGMTNGVTNFTRQFDDSTLTVVASAPAVHGGANFLQWVDGFGGVLAATPTATLNVADGAVARAEYEANAGNPRPDLLIDSFTAVLNGTSVDFSATVRNAGNLDSAACSLALSFNIVGFPSPGGGDAALAVGPLAAGATTVVNFSLPNAPAGLYVPEAFVDSLFQVVESAESNNTSNLTGGPTTLTVPGPGGGERPDLTLTSFTATALGQSTTYQIGVLNQGAAASPACLLFLSFNGDAVTNIMEPVPALPSGGSTTLTLFRTNVPPGTYTSRATVDGSLIVAETVEGNNTAFSNPHTNTLVGPGDGQLVTWSVSNVNSANILIDTPDLFGFTDGTTLFTRQYDDAVASVVATAPAIAQGRTFQRWFNASAGVEISTSPSATIPISDGLTVRAEYESDPGNPLPDLAIDMFDVSVSGSDIAFAVTVSNIGNAPSAPCTLALFHNHETIMSAPNGDQVAAVGALAPGAQATFNFALNGAPLGNYMPVAFVDIFFVVAESSESNNGSAPTSGDVMGGTVDISGNVFTFSSLRANAVPITVDVPDLTGQSSGTTDFFREFDLAVPAVTATAPAAHQGVNFQRWVDIGSGAVIATTPAASIPISDGGGARAEYQANPADMRPDLIVSAFTAQLLGPDVLYQATVRNAGNAASTACSLAIYHNIAGVMSPPDGDANLAVGALAPGASTVLNFALRNAPAGDYTPLAFADVFDGVAESSETNNFSLLTSGGTEFTVPGGGGGGDLPDLAITSFTALALGQGTTYNITVRNQGDAASTACMLGLSYNSDMVFEDADLVPTLGPGASANLTLFRVNAPPGTYTARARVDLLGEVAEEVESNNDALSNAHTNTAVNPGDGQLVIFTTGGADTVPISLDTADLFGFTDGVTVFTRQFPDTVTTVTASAPGVHQGRFFERWTIPSTGQTLGTTPTVLVPVSPDLTVRAHYGPDPGNPLPDLTIDAFGLTVAGGDLLSTVTVRNLGNAEAAASTLAIYYNYESVPSNPAGDDTQIVGPIPAGGSVVANFALPSAPAGDYAPLAFIDLLDVVAESSETNNASLPTSGSVGGTVTVDPPDDPALVTFTSARAGMVPVVIDTPDLGGLADGVTSFTRSYDAAATPTVTATAPATHQGLNFQQWVDPATGGVISATPTAVVAVVDGLTARAEYEANAGNPLPDLTVNFFTASVIGSDVVYQAQIANVGNADAAACSVALYHGIAGFPSPPQGDELLPIGPLTAGATALVNFTLANAPAGEYTPVVFADSQDVVAESVESNNTSFLSGGDTTIDVDGPGGTGGMAPDLLVSQFDVVATGLGTTYALTVRNQGNAASAPTTLNLHYDLGGPVDDTANVPLMAAGGQATFNFVRVAAPAGTHVAFAEVDPANAVAESEEANNTAISSPHTNTAPDPGEGQLMTFSAANVDSVPVGVGLADLNGETDGVTTFSRLFDDAAASVMATAPATHQGRAFTRWYDPDRAQVISTSSSADITIIPGRVARAEYEPDAGNPLPDLTITSLDVFLSGDDLNFEITVENVGNADAGASNLALFHNRAGVPSPPGGDDSMSVGVLGVGAQATLIFSLADAIPGTYMPSAFIDSFDMVAESSETNNIVFATGGDIDGDGTVTIDPGSGSDNTSVVTFTSALADSVPIALDTADVGGLQDGVTNFSREFAMGVTSVMATAPAVHQGVNFIRWADGVTDATIASTPTAAIPVFDGAVVQAVYDIDPASPRPDLIVQDFTATVFVDASNRIIVRYRARVANVGNANTNANGLGDSRIAVFNNIAGFPSPPGGDLSIQVPSIPAGASVSRSLTITGAPPGTYNPVALADSAQWIAESSESNNSLPLQPDSQFIIPDPGPGGPRPDLTISQFTATADGAGTTYRVTVLNQGLVSSPACSLDVSYEGGAFNRRVAVPSISPNNSVQVVAYRTNAPVGTYVAEALVDSTQVVNESDETNNGAFSNAHTNTPVGGNDGQQVTFSSALVNAVPVTLSVADLNGDSNGVTDFARQFSSNTLSVEATVPGIHEGQFFVRWFDASDGSTISATPLATIPVVAGLVARVEYSADPVNPLPDLVINSFTGSFAGSDINFEVEVQNIGNAGSPACVLALYYNREGFPSPMAGDQTIAVEALAPGQTSLKSFSVPGAPQGVYEPTAFVDSEQTVAESAETNNVSQMTAGGFEIEVPGEDLLPDLRIPSFSAVANGAGTTYTLMVMNQGDAASAASTLAISYEGDGSFDAFEPVPALEIGETATIVAFRFNAPAGTYVATALADSSGVIAESDETNNAAASNQHTNTEVGGNQGVLVTFTSARVDSVPVTIQEGDLFGETDGVTLFTRRYPDGTPSVTASAPSIHQGANFQQWFNPVTGQVIATTPQATIPVAAGTVARAEYSADPGNPLPDLVVDSLSITVSGSDITLDAIARNVGNADAAACDLIFFLNREGGPGPGQPADPVVPVGALAAGASVPVSAALQALPDGRYLPVAFVDVFGVVAESSETNNASLATSGDIDDSGTVDLGLPDLTIQSFTAVALGQGTTYDVLVRNIGQVGSDACSLAILPDGATVPAEVVGSVPPLQPNGFVRLTLLRENAPPGTYTAFAFVDLDGVVIESDELNNAAFSNPHTNTPVDSSDGKRMTFTSAQVQAVPVTLDVVDLFGRLDGVTTFERQFPDSAAQVKASAPAVHGTQQFVRWYDPFRGVTLSSEPDAQIDIIDGRVARAEYAPDASNPRPDLVIDSFEADANAGDITFTLRVSNVGNATASANSLALYYLHESLPSPSEGDAVLAVPQLAAGASATLQNVLMDATPGVYEPLAFVDSLDVVAESAEDNNLATLSVGDGVIMVEPDDAQRMIFTADRVDNVPLTVSLADLTGQKGGVTTFTRLYEENAPPITVTAPSSHQGLAFEQWLDSLSGQVLSTNRQVTVAVADGRTLRAQYAADPANPRPDLIVSRFQAEPLGRGVVFEIDVTNVGNATAGAHELALYHDAAGAPVGGMGADQIAQVDELAPGETAMLTMAWVDTPPGRYTPWTFVDSGFAVAESAEGNNAAGLDTSVCLNENGSGGSGGGGSSCGGGGIDVNPGSGTRLVVFTSGRADNVPILVDTFDETGRSDGVTTFSRTYLAGVQTITATAPDTHAGNAFVRWFNGETGEVFTDPVVTVAVVDGMILRAEYDGAATGPGPDLVVDRFDVVTNGVDATFSIVVRNIGDAPANASSLAIFENLAEAPTSGLGAVRVVPVPALATNAVMSADETVLNILPRGDYQAWALIDSEDVILETVESNNAVGPARYSIRDPVDGFVTR